MASSNCQQQGGRGGSATAAATLDAESSMAGKYCIVTGSNSGIGLEVARGLMRRGAHVVMACRNMIACERAAAALRGEGLSGSCACKPVDLENPSSIRAFVQQQASELADNEQGAVGGDCATGASTFPPETTRRAPGGSGGGGAVDGSRSSGRRRHVDVLVNNAGVMGVSLAPDGSDRHLTANHLGPYLLTRLLLPHMTHGSRIVNVASRAHYHGSLSLVSGPSGPQAIQNDTHHWFWQYARSKLCNVLFTAELQRRYGRNSPFAFAAPGNVAVSITAGNGGGSGDEASIGIAPGAGSGIARICGRGGGGDRGIGVFAVSPGMVDTGIFRYLLPGWAQWLRAPLRPFVRTAQQGAEVVIFAASSPKLAHSSPLFLHDCREMQASAAARDGRLAANLWRASARLVGLPPEDEDGEA